MSSTRAVEMPADLLPVRRKKGPRRKDVEAQADQWTQSHKPATYLDEVERQAARQTLSSQEQPAYDAWIAWARAPARRLDPLADGLPVDLSPEPSKARSEQRG
jgi:hypothetical protein